MKMQNSTLPKFENSIFEKIVFGEMKILDTKTLKNAKSAPQNLKFDWDFGIWDPEIHFQKSKIDFSNSSRILIRDLKI